MLRVRRWARYYAAPLVLAAVLLVFGVVMRVFVRAHAPASVVVISPAPDEDAPLHTLCPVCGLGESCDKEAGRCMLDASSPPPCSRGAHFDEKEGFCIPNATPRPTAVPSKTLDPLATPRPPPTPDLTWFLTPRPLSTSTPRATTAPAPATSPGA